MVLTDPARAATASAVPAATGHAPEILLISAQSRAALNDLAADYAARLDSTSPEEIARVAAAAAHRRERLPFRLAAPLGTGLDLAAALRTHAEGEEDDAAVVGQAVERAADVAFVYSGNGSQWVGMGREAYDGNATFRERFDRTDALFEPLSGWSLKEAMFAADLDQRLSLTRVSQPLIFAIQSASTAALRAKGLTPNFVLGHSVGEIAAAEAAGILSLEQAVRVIFFRSKHQETTRGFGTMAVLLGPVEEMETFLAEYPTLDIAAYNSPKAITVAGPEAAIEAAMKALTRKRRRGRKLDLEYPFHGRLMDPTERPLLRDLDGLTASAGHTAMVSTVTGTVLPGLASAPATGGAISVSQCASATPCRRRRARARASSSKSARARRCCRISATPWSRWASRSRPSACCTASPWAATRSPRRSPAPSWRVHASMKPSCSATIRREASACRSTRGSAAASGCPRRPRWWVRWCRAPGIRWSAPAARPMGSNGMAISIRRSCPSSTTT